MKLSPRQLEVLALICEGKSNKEIGKELHITESTAKAHAGEIFKRMGVHNRAEAMLASINAVVVEH